MSRLSHLLPVLLLCAAMQLAVADRYLKQTVLDCTKSHPACTSCSAKRTAGFLVSYSRLVCRSCASPGYVLFANSTTSSCACAAGFFSPPGAPDTCMGCPKNSWCPGGGGGAGGATAEKQPCGNCLMTVTTLAQHVSACITQPGCGYKPDGTASACPKGTYSSGNNRQPCVPCPSGLMTSSTRAASLSACMAPPGYFFQNMQALPCPKGSFKDSVSRATSCTPCPLTGLTTEGTAATDASACSLAQPGFMPVVENGTVTSVVPCPAGTYSSDGMHCLNCTDGLTTQSAGSTSPTDCTAPPGFGYYDEGVGDDNPVTTAALQALQQKVVRCPAGSWKADWSLAPCKSCGVNMSTDTSGGLGVSADLCFLPAGWGSVLDAKSQRLVASRCRNGSYGAAEAIYGTDAHPCQPCPPNTVTPDQVPSSAASVQKSLLLTSPDKCSTKPGFGWEDGAAVPCAIGWYSTGYDNRACTKCGTGLTTARVQSARPSDCLPLPGWQKQQPADNFATPCPAGSFSQGGNDTCHKCPLGSSTQYASSFSVSQCSVCAPGWGSSVLSTTNNSSQCSICTPGWYSPGGSDEPCSACSPGQTSTVAATSSADCYDAFVSTAPYDFIDTPPAAWTPFSLGEPAVNASAQEADAATRCKTACQVEELCQYWVFREAQPGPDTNGCFLKLAPEQPAADTFTSLKLATGDYLVFPAGVDEYGMRARGAEPWSPTDGSAVEPWSCLRGCDTESTCLGVFTTRPNSTWQCWMLGGATGLGGTASSIKVSPTQINAWLWAANAVATDATEPPPPSPPAGPFPSSPAPASSPAVTEPDNSPMLPEVEPDITYFPTWGATPPSAPANNSAPAANSAPASSPEPEAPASNTASNNSAPAANGAAVNTPQPEAPASNNSAPAANGAAVNTPEPAEPASNNSAPAANGPAVNTPAEPASNAASNNSALAVNGAAVNTPQPEAPASNNSAPAANGAAVNTPEPAEPASNNSAPAVNGAAVNTPQPEAPASNNSAPAANGAAVNTPEPAEPASNNSAPAANGPAANTPAEPASNAASINSAPAVNGAAVNTPQPEAPASNNSAPAANGAAVNTPEPAKPASNNSAPAANGPAVNTPAEPASNVASNNSAPAVNGAAGKTPQPEAPASNAASNSSAPTADGAAVNAPEPEAPASNAASNNSAPADSRPVNGSCIPDHIATYAGVGDQAFLGDDAPATSAGLLYPTGLALDRNGSVYIASSGQHRIRRVDAVSGLISTVCGIGTPGAEGDGGPAVAAQLNTPTSVAFDKQGHMFVTEALGNRVRRVDAVTGIITSVVGTGKPGFAGDGGQAAGAQLKNPVHAAFDAAGNLFIADFGNARIRRVHMATGVISTFAGVGTPGYAGDGGSATQAELNNPSSIVFDKGGNMLVADSLSHAVRIIDTTGTIHTIAGTAGKYGFSGDGAPATAARLWSPMAVALDAAGNLWISDSYSNRIRRVDVVTGVIDTVAGTASGGFLDSSSARDALLSNPQGLVVDADGSVLFSDYNNHRIRKLTCST